MPLKRGVLLAGTWGTGKTLSAYVAAKKCIDNNWTFIYCEQPEDLLDCVRASLSYLPAVVFCEDIDRVASADGGESNRDLINLIDSLETKNRELIVVFTTNVIEKLSQALLRPGRLDAVIEVTPPDANAAEKLIYLYAGDRLVPGCDLSLAGEALAGQIPAKIGESTVKAKSYALLRGSMDEEGLPLVDGQDIIDAARMMQYQDKLLIPKPEDTRSAQEKAAAIMAEGRVEAARVMVGFMEQRDKVSPGEQNGAVRRTREALPAEGAETIEV